MTDARLYALMVWLREQGVDVCPGLEYTKRHDPDCAGLAFYAWNQDNAHAAIVVWCMGALRDACWSDEEGRKILAVGFSEYNGIEITPRQWLLAVADARGLAVPAELTKEVEGEH